MRLTITINTDSAAFDDDTAGEISRILRRLCRELEANGLDAIRGETMALLDTNGNRVGVLTTDDGTPVVARPIGTTRHTQD